MIMAEKRMKKIMAQSCFHMDTSIEMILIRLLAEDHQQPRRDTYKN